MISPRKLFIIKPDHVLDIITNSSSELFVLEAETINAVKELISSVYPDYENEYTKPKGIISLSLEELNKFVRYYCNAHFSPCSDKSTYPLLPGYSFDELYELEKNHWSTRLHYKLKNNIPEDKRFNSWHSAFVTEENHAEVLTKICPNGNWFFMYSKDENPDYNMQEKLSEIASRYHLG